MEAILQQIELRSNKEVKKTKHHDEVDGCIDTLDITQYSYVVNNKLEAMTLYFMDMSLLIPELVDLKKTFVAASGIYIARAIVGVQDEDGQ